MSLLVADLSNNNGRADRAAVAALRAAGIAGAYLKVTEGLHFVDGTAAGLHAHAVELGLPVGGYHFGHPGNDPVSEADAFCVRLAEIGAWQLPPVLDLEVADGQNPEHNTAWAAAFCDRVAHRTGVEPVIYTGKWWWDPNTHASGPLGRYRLWLASYTRTAPALYPWGGQHWLWQFTDRYQVPGIGPVDMSVFEGTTAELLGHPVPAAHPAPVGPALPAHPAVPAQRTPGNARVLELQKLFGLTGADLDGVWGPHTDAAASRHLLKAGAGLATPHGNPLVAWVQTQLCRKFGAHMLGVDGKFGPATDQALRRWVPSCADGVVGPRTYRELAS